MHEEVNIMHTIIDTNFQGRRVITAGNEDVNLWASDFAKAVAEERIEWLKVAIDAAKANGHMRLAYSYLEELRD
jgi:hypothetical protein